MKKFLLLFSILIIGLSGNVFANFNGRIMPIYFATENDANNFVDSIGGSINITSFMSCDRSIGADTSTCNTKTLNAVTGEYNGVWRVVFR